MKKPTWDYAVRQLDNRVTELEMAQNRRFRLPSPRWVVSFWARFGGMGAGFFLAYYLSQHLIWGK